MLVMNYCNWQRPGPSDDAKAGLVGYLQNGGGLVIVHFTNGAFHFSLAGTPDSDWPEWRTKICRRVWDHTPGKSGHDAYGKFRVQIAKSDHPITQGLEPYETTDELHFRQQGEEPIEVLGTARSKVTGADEPMTFVYEYGKGRVFQTVLGHDAAAIRVPGTSDLMRRGAVWTAGRPQRAVEPVKKEPAPAETRRAELRRHQGEPGAANCRCADGRRLRAAGQRVRSDGFTELRDKMKAIKEAVRAQYGSNSAEYTQVKGIAV